MQQDNSTDSLQAAPIDDSLFDWEAVIFGPEDSIWEGGIFTLRMKFSDDYPSKPPSIKFLTKMFHPNIYSDGSICLDILKEKWSPVYDVLSVLMSIQSLLNDPNPNSPANGEAAQLFSQNYQEYCSRVKKIIEQSQADNQINEVEGDGF